MIHYFVSEQYTNFMQEFLQSSGQPLAHRIKVVTYEGLLAGREGLPDRGGAYIFANPGWVRNRLDPPARKTIYDLHDRLVETHGARKVLNNPARSLRRYDMLRRLHEHGINSFNAYRANDPTVQPRFPVLVRHESWSLYKQPSLAHNLDQYEALLRGAKWSHGSLAEFISVEFCDTKDADGLYRKYGAFVIGDRIIPRHIFFSRDWHVRSVDVVDRAMVEEELRFLNANPHAETLLQCARLAGIGYGRIDYGLLGGHPQIWEINTNASIASTSMAFLPERREVLTGFLKQFAAAMEAIDLEDVTSNA